MKVSESKRHTPRVWPLWPMMKCGHRLFRHIITPTECLAAQRKEKTVRTWTINEMAAANLRAGRYWFTPDSIRFFDTRFESEVYTRPQGVYFITSEKPPYGPRQYSVRRFDPEAHSVSTVGEFGTTKAAALTLLASTTYEEGA